MSAARHHGIHVLTVSGTDREMGYQHGVALREAIRRGPLPAFSRYVERLLAGSLGGLAGPVAKGMGIALSETIGRAIAAKLPRSTLEALEGLADGACIPRRELMRAVTMPETYLFVASQWIARRGLPGAPRLAVPLYGCTSAIAWGDGAEHGRMLHGRNFDYQGVGTWDREQAVVFHRPEDGQRYVSISAAGILFGGITAMNEAGLTLVVHQHLYSTDFALGGLPVGIVGDRVMRHARSLDDARRILDDHVPNGSWTYVITSAKEQAVLCYEVTAKRRAVVPVPGPTFGYSNVFLARALANREAHGYPTHWRNVIGRYHRATALLEERRGHDVRSIAAILADRGTPACRFHDSIAGLQTVASVVFDAAAGVVWVATGRAPVSQNPYVAFDLRTERPRDDDPIRPTSEDASARLAFEAYRDAYEAAFHQGDWVEARRCVEVARRAQPEQPVYHFVAGLMSLRTGDSGNAERAFDRAIACRHPSRERLSGFHLWRARTHDLRGARDRAQVDYRAALDGDPSVRAAADRGLMRPWTGGAIPIEWSFGDVVAP
ncbi:MAG: hypothetical protein HYV09_02905 [Deltaproteobacteria bacterium]|nr:hypothetical protein [Deltaproteobacteria bacterium]